MFNFAALTEQLKSLQTPAGIEALVAKSQAAFEDLSAKSKASLEDLAAQSRANVEAVVASQGILTKGSEELSRELVAFTQASVEKSIALGKTIAGVKSPEELVSLQTSLVKESVESAVAEAKRVSEASVALLKSAGAPIQARIEAGVAAAQAQVAALQAQLAA